MVCLVCSARLKSEAAGQAEGKRQEDEKTKKPIEIAPPARKAAAEPIANPARLRDTVKVGRDAPVRTASVEQLIDDAAVQTAAAEKITDQTTLADLAKNGTYAAVRATAVKKLRLINRPSPGAVYLMPIEPELFGACRVISYEDSTPPRPAGLGYRMLVMTTAWIGSSAPDLQVNARELRTPLRKTFGEWTGDPEVSWVEDVLPPSLTLIGILPPTPEELQLSTKYSQSWGARIGQALRQARFDGKAAHSGSRSSESESITDELIRASARGRVEEVKALIARGADVNAKSDGWDGDTALILACGNTKLEVAQTLLNAGADVNAKGHHGNTALMTACDTTYLEEVQMLLNRGADVNAKANDDSTALMAASSRNDCRVAQALLSKGADINAEDNEGRTALTIAIGRLEYEKRFADIVSFLFNAGAKL